MTKLTINEYIFIINEKEHDMVSCNDRLKMLQMYLEFVIFQVNHSYILQELPYYYIRSLHDWVNSSMIYVEYCLSIEESQACIRLISVKHQIIELINNIIEITSDDYDILNRLYNLVIKLNEFLENLHPSLITTPYTQNNIHLTILSIIPIMNVRL
jgi:hypothetical protein